MRSIIKAWLTDADGSVYWCCGVRDKFSLYRNGKAEKDGIHVKQVHLKGAQVVSHCGPTRKQQHGIKVTDTSGQVIVLYSNSASNASEWVVVLQRLIERCGPVASPHAGAPGLYPSQAYMQQQHHQQPAWQQQGASPQAPHHSRAQGAAYYSTVPATPPFHAAAPTATFSSRPPYAAEAPPPYQGSVAPRTVLASPLPPAYGSQAPYPTTTVAHTQVQPSGLYPSLDEFEHRRPSAPPPDM